MKRWKIGVLCAVIACLCFALTGCQSEEYTPKSKEQAVSAAALGKDGTLRVGVNASSAPLAGQTSSSSRIVGIDVDVAAYIADQMGLEVIEEGQLPFWDNGVKYFTILGPNREKLEFNQYL